jgi:hypothetical protein
MKKEPRMKFGRGYVGCGNMRKNTRSPAEQDPDTLSHTSGIYLYTQIHNKKHAFTNRSAKGD